MKIALFVYLVLTVVLVSFAMLIALCDFRKTQIEAEEEAEKQGTEGKKAEAQQKAEPKKGESRK